MPENLISDLGNEESQVNDLAVHFISKQKDIYEALHIKNPELAGLYKGAVQNVTLQDNPAWVYFVGHAVREIANNLQNYFTVPIKSERVEYVNELDKIADRWPNDLQLKDLKEISLPIKAVKPIDALIEKHRKNRELGAERAARILSDTRYGAKYKVKSGILDPVVRQWSDITKWFVEITHLRKPGEELPEAKAVMNRFGLFEQMLYAKVCPFYSTVKELDDLLKTARPTDSDLDKLKALIKIEEHYNYFFNNLDNPAWIPLLREGGFLQRAPEPIQEGERVQFPFWPISRYLARVAGKSPEEVCDAILSIEDSQNFYIYDDFMEAALEMPIDIADRMVAPLKSWLKKPYLMSLPKKAAKFIVKLTDEGRFDEAFDLASELLNLSVEVRESDLGAERAFINVKVKAHMDNWEYEEILNKEFSRLEAIDPLRSLSMLSGKLRFALNRERQVKGYDGYIDYSYISRPTIEPSSQNGHHKTIEDALIDHIRDDCEELIKRGDAEAVKKALDLFDELKYPLFLRLKLHVLRLAAGQFGAEVETVLADKALFDDSSVQHKYALLFREQFGTLMAGSRQTILGWIEEGPDLEPFIKYKEETDEKASEEDKLLYKKDWQAEKLAIIKGSLDETWLARYRELEAEVGEPEHPEYPVYYGDWEGNRSPLSQKQIESMDAKGVLDYVKVWNPAEAGRDITPEELSNTLSGDVAKAPKKYTGIALDFVKETKSIYVRALFRGFRQALENDIELGWEDVFKAIDFILTQPDGYKVGVPVESYESSQLKSLRQDVTDLIMQSITTSGANKIPYDLREEVWAAIDNLAEDPNPSTEHEAKSKKEGFSGFYAISLNTVRGRATHAAIAYALWVARTQKESGELEATQEPLDAVPEFRALLEHKLDPTIEPSKAVRSVLGRYLTQLCYLSAGWVRDNVGRIFPKDPANQEFGRIAWEAYLAWSNIYTTVYEVIKEEYRIAVESLPDDRQDRDKQAALEHLGEHLMILLMWGKEVYESGSVIHDYFIKAPEELRSDAIGFIGRELVKQGEWQPEKIERLEAFWGRRLEDIEKAKEEIAYINEIAEFGWWFASGRFDKEKSINLLLKTLQLSSGKLKWKHAVVERLIEYSEPYPEKTIDCLDLICKGVSERYNIAYWQAQAMEVMRRVLDGANAAAADKALNLVNYLGETAIMTLRHY